MFRASILAVGLFISMIGIECLFVETAVFTTADFSDADLQNTAAAPSNFVVSPPAWAPWGLLISGSVVMLYSFTLPHRA